MSLESKCIKTLLTETISSKPKQRRNAKTKFFEQIKSLYDEKDSNLPEEIENEIAKFFLKALKNDEINQIFLLNALFPLLSFFRDKLSSDLLFTVLENTKKTTDYKLKIALYSGIINYLDSSSLDSFSYFYADKIINIFDTVFSKRPNGEEINSINSDEFKAFLFALKSISEKLECLADTSYLFKKFDFLFNSFRYCENLENSLLITNYLLYSLGKYLKDEKTFLFCSEQIVKLFEQDKENTLAQIIHLADLVFQKFNEVYTLEKIPNYSKLDLNHPEIFNIIKRLIQHLCRIRESCGVQEQFNETNKFSKEAKLSSEKAFSTVISVLGPEIVLKAVPLISFDAFENLHSEGKLSLASESDYLKNYSVCKTWLVEVIKSCIKSPRLEFFMTSLLPLALSALNRSKEICVKMGNSFANTALENFGLSVFECFPAFCISPVDVEIFHQFETSFAHLLAFYSKDRNFAVLNELAKGLGNLARTFIDDNIQTKNESVFNKLGAFSFQHLPLFFDILLKADQQKRATFSIAINHLVRVIPAESLNTVIREKMYEIEKVSSNAIDNMGNNSRFCGLLEIFSSIINTRLNSLEIQKEVADFLFNKIENSEKQMEKKLYKAFEGFLKHQKEFFQGESGKTFCTLIDRNSHHSAIRPKIKCYKVFIEYAPLSILEDGSCILYKLLLDAFLALKTKNRKTRKAATQFIISLGEKFQSSKINISSEREVSIRDEISLFNLFELIFKCLELERQFQKSGLIDSISILFNHFASQLKKDQKHYIIKRVLSLVTEENMLDFNKNQNQNSSTSQNNMKAKVINSYKIDFKTETNKKNQRNLHSLQNDIRKSLLTFVQTAVSKMDKSELNFLLPDLMHFLTLNLSACCEEKKIVKSTTKINFDIAGKTSKNDFRGKIKIVLEKLIKKYSAKDIADFLPVEKRMVVRNIAKKLNKCRRVDQERRKINVRKFDATTTLDDYCFSDEFDSSEETNLPRDVINPKTFATNNSNLSVNIEQKRQLAKEIKSENEKFKIANGLYQSHSGKLIVMELENSKFKKKFEKKETIVKKGAERSKSSIKEGKFTRKKIKRRGDERLNKARKVTKKGISKVSYDVRNRGMQPYAFIPLKHKDIKTKKKPAIKALFN